MMDDHVALKIQRRRYSKAAVFEVSVHHSIRRDLQDTGGIIALRESFLHEGHICMAFEKIGGSLDDALQAGPMPIAGVRVLARELLEGLRRLHRCGYSHTDIKPDNILFDPQSGTLRLADLGSADDDLKQCSTFGTRGYMAPEAVIGAPLSIAVDMWSVGCTIFEMLTGRTLFNPRRAAEKKYREFSREGDATEVAVHQSVEDDARTEKAEQYRKGDVIAGKFALVREMGRGRFSTVWDARVLSDAPLDGSYRTLWEYAQSVASNADDHEQPHEEEWRRRRGADDLLDLALNYEYLLEIARLGDPIPPVMVNAARYRDAYFEADAHLRFAPVIRPCSLKMRLGKIQRDTDFGSGETFLRGLLASNPDDRLSVDAALSHPWIHGH